MKIVFQAPVALFLASALLLMPGCSRKSGETATAEREDATEQAAPGPDAAGGSPGAAAQTSEPQMIGASHILIAYQGAMRSSATRSRDEAMARAQEVLAKARQPGADFGSLAVEYSDDPTAQQNRGDLSVFPRGMMVPEFDQAAWKLQVGEISDVVETPFGFHVIKRTS